MSQLPKNQHLQDIANIPGTDEPSNEIQGDSESSAQRMLKRQADGGLDPLVVIFEQHLYNFEDSSTDRKVFVQNVVKDYLSHLESLFISVPPMLRYAVADELSEQVHTMLVKKIYGCFDVNEFRDGTPKKSKKAVKRSYRSLEKKASKVASKKRLKKKKKAA